MAGAPHDWLLPRVSGTLHHGGVAACRQAHGHPFFGDQPFWGRQIEKLGVGPPPLDRKTLSADSVSAAIVAMDDRQMRRRAAELGTEIDREDGVAAAVSFIESRIGQCPR